MKYTHNNKNNNNNSKEGVGRPTRTVTVPKLFVPVSDPGSKQQVESEIYCD